MRSRRRPLAVVATFAASLAASLVAPRAHALDPFEIQVYDGTHDEPGAFGLELHVNRVMSGLDKYDPPELPLHGQSHFTLEPSFGVTKWWEVGAYFQTALRDDGTFDYAGVKLRSKFTTEGKVHDHWRFGVNLEVSRLPEAYDRDRWGAEIRPIVAWSDDRWLFVVNPIIDVPLAGDGLDAGPTFEPAIKAARTIGPIAVGLEYYGTIGAIRAPDPLSEQRHFIYEVVDLLSVDHFELNVGVGEGLTAESKGVVVKAIVGYEFDRENKPIARRTPSTFALRP